MGRAERHRLYVPLASRRKPDWAEGTIILTSAEWYRLGAPFDQTETEALDLHRNRNQGFYVV
jgi:hypothetical protein